MPLYEYTCTECNVDHEVLQKFSDPTPTCPACGKDGLQKRVSTGSAFCLMGYGWHRAGMSVSKKID